MCGGLNYRQKRHFNTLLWNVNASCSQDSALYWNHLLHLMCLLISDINLGTTKLDFLPYDNEAFYACYMKNMNKRRILDRVHLLLNLIYNIICRIWAQLNLLEWEVRFVSSAPRTIANWYCLVYSSDLGLDQLMGLFIIMQMVRNQGNDTQVECRFVLYSLVLDYKKPNHI